LNKILKVALVGITLIHLQYSSSGQNKINLTKYPQRVPYGKIWKLEKGRETSIQFALMDSLSGCWNRIASPPRKACCIIVKTYSSTEKREFEFEFMEKLIRPELNIFKIKPLQDLVLKYGDKVWVADCIWDLQVIEEEAPPTKETQPRENPNYLTDSVKAVSLLNDKEISPDTLKTKEKQTPETRNIQDENLRLAYKNFLNYTNKLSKLIEGDKEKLNELKKEIEEIQPLPEKQWLLEQASLKLPNRSQ